MVFQNAKNRVITKGKFVYNLKSWGTFPFHLTAAPHAEGIGSEFSVGGFSAPAERIIKHNKPKKSGGLVKYKGTSRHSSL
jgi:hypothetical protein